TRGHVVASDGRKKAFAEHALDIGSEQRRLDCAPDQTGPLAENRDGLLFGLGVSIKQLFLGDAAVRPKLLVLAAVDTRAFLGETLRHHTREGQIDVVAAEEDVLADRDAIERELAAALGDGDQAEVGGAAADIDDEDQVADLNALAPV